MQQLMDRADWEEDMGECVTDYTCYTCPASRSGHVPGHRDTGSESLWLM